MKKTSYTHSRSALLLMEIIIAILFLSIVSAVCLNIFVYTHTQSEETSALNFAVRQTASLTEIIKSADSEDEADELLQSAGQCILISDTASISESASTDISLIAYFDEAYESCQSEDAVCTVTVTVDSRHETVGGVLTFWHIAAYFDDTLIYELTPEVYYAK